MDRPLVAFDTELARLQGSPFLVEVGAVRVVEGEVVDTFQSLVCSELPVDDGAFAAHGLSDRDLSGAPEAAEVVAAFLDWLGDDWVLAHRAEVDARALGFEAARAGLDLPASPLLDTLALAKRWIPEAEDHKLPTLCEHLEIECEDSHRALHDAVACWKVAEECIERMGGLDEVDGAQLLAAAQHPGSLAGHGPRTPRMKPRHRKLERACRESEEVVLTYGSGAEAPAQLPVRPRLLYQGREHGYLEAECRSSGILKTYRMDRILRVRQAR